MPDENDLHGDPGDAGFDIEIPDEVSRKVEPIRPEQFDLREVQNRSGLLMNVLPNKRSMQQNLDILGPYALLRCPRCEDRNSKFRIAVSTDQPYLMMICGVRTCGATWPVLEMSPVQVNDAVAKRTGLYIPDRRN